MVMCTYLSEGQHTKPTSDATINEVLAELRAASGEDWRVAEYVNEIPRLFRKPREYRWFELLKCVDRPPHKVEFQIINFYRPESGTSINGLVTAALVVAYMYGLLGGLQKAKTFRRAVMPKTLVIDDGLPQVAGRLECTLMDLERRARIHIRDEQERPNPDNALIATLCDAVRCAREYVEYATVGRRNP